VMQSRETDQPRVAADLWLSRELQPRWRCSGVTQRQAASQQHLLQPCAGAIGYGTSICTD
jgi:hypothetical protein